MPSVAYFDHIPAPTAAHIARTDANACGRTTYDDSLPWWGRTVRPAMTGGPSLVVTHHHQPENVPDGGGYELVVTDGVEATLGLAAEGGHDRELASTG